MEIVNIGKVEILNENPRVLYAEADYVGAIGLQNIYGYICKINGEKVNVFNAKATQKVKEIYKKSCIDSALNPKQYETIKVGAN